MGTIGISKIAGIGLNVLCVFFCSYIWINDFATKWAKAPRDKG